MKVKVMATCYILTAEVLNLFISHKYGPVKIVNQIGSASIYLQITFRLMQ